MQSTELSQVSGSAKVEVDQGESVSMQNGQASASSGGSSLWLTTQGVIVGLAVVGGAGCAGSVRYVVVFLCLSVCLSRCDVVWVLLR